MQLSQNWKIFAEFLVEFPESTKNLKYFEKKMSLRVDVSEIKDCKKTWLLKCLKNPVSEHLWTVSMLKGPKYILNEHGTIFQIFFLSLWYKISTKKLILVVSDILRLFVNMLTPDDKYSR